MEVSHTELLAIPLEDKHLTLPNQVITQEGDKVTLVLQQEGDKVTLVLQLIKVGNDLPRLRSTNFNELRVSKLPSIYTKSKAGKQGFS